MAKRIGKYKVSKKETELSLADGGDINGEFDGYLAEMHFIDGTALDASSFGETNEDTNQWQAIKYSGSYSGNSF